MNLCKCGCGGETASVWVKGHHWAVRRFNHYDVEDRGHTSPCWVFRGCQNINGYGRMTVGRRKIAAHRVFYEQFVGKIPTGLTLDHLCRVKLCVNPSHLEPVTGLENIRRYCEQQGWEMAA